MTAVSTEQDTSLLEDLADAFEIPCDIPALERRSPGGWPPCKGDPAVWVAHRDHVCEGGVTLLCDFCKDCYDGYRKAGGWVVCTWCGERGPGATFTRLKA